MLNKRHKRQNQQSHERGQSLVEMAITFPILILILSGLFDLGRLYFTFIALEEAAAEAALYLAIDTECNVENGHVNSFDGVNTTTVTGKAPRCNNPNNATYRALTSGNGEFVNGTANELLDESRLTANPRQPVRVRFNTEWDWSDYATGSVPQVYGQTFDSPFEIGGVSTFFPLDQIGNTVRVQAIYPYEFVTPGIDAIADAVTNGEGLILTVQATQLIVFEN